MPLPPVARTRDTPGWFISALVAAIDGAVIHWMQSAGAPALTAASRITRAASTEDFCALGWNPKMMGLRVFIQISDLNRVVEVGLVTGVTPATTPTGSATST